MGTGPTGKVARLLPATSNSAGKSQRPASAACQRQWAPATRGLALPRGPLPARRPPAHRPETPPALRLWPRALPSSSSHWPGHWRAATSRVAQWGWPALSGVAACRVRPESASPALSGDSKPGRTASHGGGPWRRQRRTYEALELTSLRSLESRPCTVARRTGSSWSTSTARAVCVRARSFVVACGYEDDPSCATSLQDSRVSALHPAADRRIAADDQAHVRRAAAMPPARRDAA